MNFMSEITSCVGGRPHYAPAPCKLNFDILTLKAVSESRVTWATSVPILVFLGLSVLDLGPIYATDRRQTSHVHHCLMHPPGVGHKNKCIYVCRRSQLSSGSMPDCSARGPGIESRCGQFCLSHNHCDLQPWARAVCTFPAVPRSTQPSTLRGTVNEYQLPG